MQGVAESICTYQLTVVNPKKIKRFRRAQREEYSRRTGVHLILNVESTRRWDEISLGFGRFAFGENPDTQLLESWVFRDDDLHAFGEEKNIFLFCQELWTV